MQVKEKFHSKYSEFLKKLILLLFVIIYFNIGFILFTTEVFSDFRYILIFAIFYLLIGVNILICPLFNSGRTNELSRLNTIIFIILELLGPIWIMFPYLEFIIIIQEKFSSISLVVDLISVMGIILMLLGGIIMIISRLTLGIFGTPTVTNTEQHKLITNRTYRYVRHPIYLSMIILMMGYSLSFCSFLSTLFYTISLIIFVMSRIKIEEKQLLDLFGKEYSEYMNRTKRLLPFIY